LISPGLATENEVIRTISLVNGEIQVEISPEPYMNYTMPGYYVEETIQKPLGLVDGFALHYTKKVSNSGKGIPYFQLNLTPIDKRHKTNFAIRSRTK